MRVTSPPSFLSSFPALPSPSAYPLEERVMVARMHTPQKGNKQNRYLVPSSKTSAPSHILSLFSWVQSEKVNSHSNANERSGCLPMSTKISFLWSQKKTVSRPEATPRIYSPCIHQTHLERVCKMPLAYTPRFWFNWSRMKPEDPGTFWKAPRWF